MINQIGWDARKDDELLRWIRREGLASPRSRTSTCSRRTAARAFRRGEDPGRRRDATSCSSSRSATARGPDKGRAFFVDLAAKHVAVARGLGFDGVYLGGHMPAATFGEILDRAASFAPDDWRELRARDPVRRSPTSSTSSSPIPETGLSVRTR